MTTPEQPGGGEKAPVEIERKFLVQRIPKSVAETLPPPERIRQGYLVMGADGSEARARDRGGGYTLTVKSKGDLSRGEWEIGIDEEQFETLWPATAGKQVVKNRYSIPHGAVTIELDIYEGDLTGLATAEVEFPDEQTAVSFEVPDWFGEDVTSVGDFKNQRLAVNGIPEGY